MRKLAAILTTIALALVSGCPAEPGTPVDAGATADVPLEAIDAPASGSDGGRDAGADCTTPDGDRDGIAAIACGGTDCDDADPNRAPGRAEVCDIDDRDEDCDATTFGVRDSDGDGEPDQACCNDDGGGGQNCGSDCDDTRASVSPRVVEACDALDNDCDGATDEGVLGTFYPDADLDGHGDALGTPETTCFAPTGYASSSDDCDDANGAAHPGTPEVCDAAVPPVDENCDGRANEDCDCVAGEEEPCTFLPGVCGVGTRTCVAGVWGACPITAQPEGCDGLDNDCDASTDEDFPTLGAACDGTDADECAGGTFVCAGLSAVACSDDSASIAETCDGADDDCDGTSDEDFACRLGTSTACTVCGQSGTGPCSSTCGGASSCRASSETTCNYCDADGDGIYDETSLATSDASFVSAPFCADLQQNSTVDCGEGGFFGTSVELVDGACVGVGCRDYGAAWRSAPFALGYREVVLTVPVLVDTTTGAEVGFAIVVADGSSGATLAASGVGVPTTRNGIAVEWTFRGGSADQVTLRRIGATPAALTTCTLTGGFPIAGTGTVVTVRYRPANPALGVSERLRVETDYGTCETVDARLPGFVPDTPLYLGVTAASSSTTDTNIHWLTESGSANAVLGRCP